MAVSPIDRRALPAGSEVRSWDAPDRWKLRHFSWPQPDAAAPRGSILFQTGRGDVFEKYLESFAHWHDRGWNLESFDWRGQGGSGRLTPAPHVGDIEGFDQFIADFRSFYAEWVAATPGPHVLFGHSMGGHLVLRALVEGVARPDAAVLIAPMLGVKSFFGRFAEPAAKLLASFGKPTRAAWKTNEKPYTTTTRANLLTHDPDRYADEIWWQQHDATLLTGAPSWRWLLQAFVSMRELEANPRLPDMDVPVLMLVATADALVDPQAAMRIGGRLRDARIVSFGKESAHEILREADPVRGRAIGEIDAFLEARAPRP